MIATGRPEVADSDWAELMDGRDSLPHALPQNGMTEFAWLAVDLDRLADAAEVVDRCHVPNWSSVARAILAGDAATAADLLEEMDHLADAAYARLRAGGEHVRAALRFYESVGATRFVQEGRARLEASA
jgi:hypothetical protein